jgi:hypothetical protein
MLKFLFRRKSDPVPPQPSTEVTPEAVANHFLIGSRWTLTGGSPWTTDTVVQISDVAVHGGVLWVRYKYVVVSGIPITHDNSFSVPFQSFCLIAVRNHDAVAES